METPHPAPLTPTDTPHQAPLTPTDTGQASVAQGCWKPRPNRWRCCKHGSLPCHTYPPLDEVQEFRVALAEVGVPKLDRLVQLRPGEGPMIRFGYLAKTVCTKEMERGCQWVLPW